jgi:hypothetical protein
MVELEAVAAGDQGIYDAALATCARTPADQVSNRFDVLLEPAPLQWEQSRFEPAAWRVASLLRRLRDTFMYRRPGAYDWAPRSLRRRCRRVRGLLRDMSRATGVPVEPESRTRLLGAWRSGAGVPAHDAMRRPHHGRARRALRRRARWWVLAASTPLLASAR